KPKRTPINVLPIPDDNISEDSFDDEESDYQPDNMELEVEDSDDDVLEPETDEADESEENMQTDSDEEEMLKSKRKKKETKGKKSVDKSKKFSWKTNPWKRPRSSNIPVEKMKPSDSSFSNLCQPFKFFKQFLTKDLLDHITFQTNLYNTQHATLGYK
ncbi:Hypothetical predicted protein, partial [Paramuricea clavata]